MSTHFEAREISVGGQILRPSMSHQFLLRINGKQEISVSSMDVNYFDKTISASFYEYVDQDGISNVERIVHVIESRIKKKLKVRLDIDMLWDGDVMYTDAFLLNSLFDHHTKLDFDVVGNKKVTLLFSFDKHKRVRP